MKAIVSCRCCDGFEAPLLPVERQLPNYADETIIVVPINPENFIRIFFEGWFSCDQVVM